MRALSFIINAELYAADVTSIERAARRVRLTPVPTSGAFVAGIMNINGRVIVAVDITARDKRGGEISCVIFKPPEGDERVGLVVDKALGIVDIDESVVKDPPSREGDDDEIRFLMGVAPMGENFYRVINVDKLFRGEDI